MGQFFIIRVIGSLLLCGVSLNVAVLLAAPVYWKNQPESTPSTPFTETQPTEDSAETHGIEPETNSKSTTEEHPAPGHNRADTGLEKEAVDQTMVFLENQAKQALQNFGTTFGKTADPVSRQMSSIARRLTKNKSSLATVDPAISSRKDSNSELRSAENLRAAGERTERIVLVNSKTNDLPVSFLANGNVQTLEPGDEYTKINETIVIRYDRGGQLGTAEQILEPGRYRFDVSSESGWKLNPESSR